jgi:NADPH:quinone reductase-like Zn-dependent oxidoreductase
LYKVGDAVYGTMPPLAGSCATTIKAAPHALSWKPANISHIEASVLPLVGLTAIQALGRHHLKPEQNILVIGASGGVGHIVTQIARARGARVIAICSTRNKAFVEGLGAHTVICYDEDGIGAKLHDYVENHGLIDFVFDTVTSNNARDQAYGYEKQIRFSDPPLMQSPQLGGKYISIGGSSYHWLLAHVKRIAGRDWFPKGRELAWVRFARTSQELAGSEEYAVCLFQII